MLNQVQHDNTMFGFLVALLCRNDNLEHRVILSGAKNPIIVKTFLRLDLDLFLVM